MKSPPQSRQKFRALLLPTLTLFSGIILGAALKEIFSSADSQLSISDPGEGEQKNQETNLVDSRQSLLHEVALRVDDLHKEKCLAMIRGEHLDSFSQGYQDWLLFHNFFSRYPFGSGFYLDLGSNNPVNSSNTFFFDHCLGWKGICLEPNPAYADPTRKFRTCELVPHCISAEPIEVLMNFGEDQVAKVHTLGQAQEGPGMTRVQCVTLESILRDHNVTRADFVSLDVEGQELPVIQCFPFDAFDLPVWMVETNKAGGILDHTFMRAGYAKVKNALERQDGMTGSMLDSLFVRQAPFVQGPAFLPGGKHHGKHYAGNCGENTQECVPNVVMHEYYQGEKAGACNQLQHPLS